MKDFVFAIIPAAGCGSRMNTTINKQFIELCGIPVIIRTLLAFEHSNLIDGIIVSARASDQTELLRLCESYKISKLLGVAKGGITRQDSVRNSLNYLAKLPKTNLNHSDSYNPAHTYVLIHDGARPFVTPQIIEDSVCMVKRYKSCGIGIPVKDTIKRIKTQSESEHIILETLPRDTLWAIQTPQSFSFQLIRHLHRMAFKDGLTFTDDTAIAEHYNRKTIIIPGDYRNIKITTPEDILYGEFFLKNFQIPQF